MKINSVNINYRNYQSQNFKAQPKKNNIEISFDENDMEKGSIAGAFFSMLLLFPIDKKLRNGSTGDKNLIKTAMIFIPIIALGMFATMGIMSFIKITNRIKENKNRANNI